MINFTNLEKIVYVSIWILERFTMEDRKHTHDCWDLRLKKLSKSLSKIMIAAEVLNQNIQHR